MLTILRVRGWRFVVYPNDHSPAHVHVLGPNWAVVVDLVDLCVREVIGCNERQARQVLSIASDHQQELTDAWRLFHG